MNSLTKLGLDYLQHKKAFSWPKFSNLFCCPSLVRPIEFILMKGGYKK